MTSDALLVHYNPNKPVVLACDASPWAVGGILSHVNEDGSTLPIAYFSQTLSAPERNYSQMDREALAIIKGVKKFHNYLYGRYFQIFTDHRPLLGLLGENCPTPVLSSPRMVRWALFLSNYTYTLVHQPGRSLGHVDALSKFPVQKVPDKAHASIGNVLLMENLPEVPLKANVVANMTNKDPVLGRVKNFLNSGWPNNIEDQFKPYFLKKDELSIYRNCILWGSRVIIPERDRSRSKFTER